MIGWKECIKFNPNTKSMPFDIYLVKLDIPDDAIVCKCGPSDLVSNRYRCSKARVIDIIGNPKTDVVESLRAVTWYARGRTKSALSYCTYKLGEMVYPDSFDEDPTHAYSNGIYFIDELSEVLKYKYGTMEIFRN